MTGWAYLDRTNRRMVTVPARYPEDINDYRDIEKFNAYIRKHPDEKEFLVDKHQLDKRIFREQCTRNDARKLGGMKFLDTKPCEDESWAEHLKTKVHNDT